MAQRIVVVGAGVIGLTCAVRLAEAGHDVHVLARDLPRETTSAIAAALWYPYRAAPFDAVTRWAAAAYDELVRICAADPRAGVDLVPGFEVLRAQQPDPWWRAAVPELERMAAADRPAGFADGWRLTLPVADTSHYLPWLVSRLEAAGGTLTRRWLDALPDSGVVVNCSGLAARHLAGDSSVRPVRGQVLRVACPGIDSWVLDGSDKVMPVYVVPRRDDVVVGGTATEDDWDLGSDERTSRELMERATALDHRLAQARVMGVRVGLRPARPAVRLETQHRRAGVVVHCYGHGGAGVTLSWGCAADVLRAVEQVV